MAMKGYRIAILEKEKFPREHVGESLLPFCYEVFQTLGVLDELKACFVRKPSVRFISSDGSTSTNWCFNHVIKNESHLSFQVVRSKFDQMLLENARRHGAEVYEQTRVSQVHCDGDHDLIQVQAIDSTGNARTYDARFLIDASGRSSFMAAKNRWRRPHEGFERPAVWTHWADLKVLKGGLEEGASLIINLGGDKRGWIWVFPLGREHVTAGVVMDSSYLRDAKRQLQPRYGPDWQAELYLQELKTSAFVRDLLDDAKMSMSLQIEGDYSYFSEVKFGARYAIVGDAGRFIDPIFSSGIYLSIKSSALVSAALDGMLIADNLDNMQPIEEAYSQINGAYDLVYRLIKLFYNPHAVSWAEAGSAFPAEHKGHEDAMAAGHYILAGDFFENHKKYQEFLDLLEDPRLFDGYRNLVINREAFNTTSCNVDRSLIFPALHATV
jgi:flavin-dependent dehydrogenase